MKYVKHYRIAHDDLVQVEYADNVAIPDGIEINLTPFEGIPVVKSLGHGDDNPMVVETDHTLIDGPLVRLKDA